MFKHSLTPFVHKDKVCGVVGVCVWAVLTYFMFMIIYRQVLCYTCSVFHGTLMKNRTPLSMHLKLSDKVQMDFILQNGFSLASFYNFQHKSFTISTQ